jgi:hypothetical protein
MEGKPCRNRMNEQNGPSHILLLKKRNAFQKRLTGKQEPIRLQRHTWRKPCVQ